MRESVGGFSALVAQSSYCRISSHVWSWKNFIPSSHEFDRGDWSSLAWEQGLSLLAAWLLCTERRRRYACSARLQQLRTTERLVFGETRPFTRPTISNHWGCRGPWIEGLPR